MSSTLGGKPERPDGDVLSNDVSPMRQMTPEAPHPRKPSHLARVSDGAYLAGYSAVRSENTGIVGMDGAYPRCKTLPSAIKVEDASALENNPATVPGEPGEPCGSGEPAKMEAGETWFSSAAYAQGQGHARRGEPCQDRAVVAFENGVYTACLADGAGSRKQSQHGAQAIVHALRIYLSRNFDNLFSEDASHRLSQMENIIARTLSKAARKRKCQERELASTLLAVAVKDDRYIMVHLGDGVIGAVVSGELRVMSFPENGEYANETVFTTSPHLGEHLRVETGNASDISGFILMSDGAADTLHVHDTDILAPATVKLMLYCAEHPDEIDEGLHDTLEEMLVPKTADDCSVALLARRPEQLRECLEKVSDGWTPQRSTVEGAEDGSPTDGRLNVC